MSSSSLYIHIPFCFRKCLFCSFVIAVGQEHRRDEYVEALVEEMKKKGVLFTGHRKGLIGNGYCTLNTDILEEVKNVKCEL